MTESEDLPVMSDEEVKRQGKALGVIGGVLGLGVPLFPCLVCFKSTDYMKNSETSRKVTIGWLI